MNRSVFTATTTSTACRRPPCTCPFGSLGANARAYVPHRKREGYGLNAAAVQRLHDEGVSLLVTSDCGTTSHHEVALAKQLGMDVIVTDHHQTGEEMPPAVAVMNPHRAGARYPFQGCVPRDWPTKWRRPINCASARRASRWNRCWI